MKFKATTNYYDPDTGDHVQEEVEFDDVVEYGMVDQFMVVTLSNGDKHATSKQIVKYSFTK